MSPAPKPTIYDVARLAGVSISTVSRVLNEPYLVREKTRNLVMNAIDELSYTPKAEASARARKDFERIGVLTPFFSAPSFVQRLNGIAAALDRTKYELIIYTVESRAQLEGYLSMLQLSRRLDGLIIMSLPLGDQEARALKESGLETVLIEYSHTLFSSINIDNYEGGAMAARYLANRGYSRFGFLGDAGEETYALHPSDLRLAGYRETLKGRGHDLPEGAVHFAPYGRESVVCQGERVFDAKHPPEAVFAASDMQAIGLLKAARTRGMKVPGDIAVIGFDGIDIAEFMELTTISQELNESGRLAAELLISRIRSGARPTQEIRLPLRVVEGETC
jgi:LacI family transcriptional regulator